MRWLQAVLVDGPSMLPALRPGDCLLVRGGRRVRAGDVVVARFPSRPGLLVVKRAVHPADPEDLRGPWEVRGDNPAVQDDSRRYGPAEVLGTVVLRWWPPRDFGPVPRCAILSPPGDPRPTALPMHPSRAGPSSTARPPAASAGDPPGARPMTAELEDRAARDADPAFALHRGGKIAVVPTVPVETREDLSLAYTPGVARVCTAIAEDRSLVYDYTWKSHTVAVVTDGSAVLGLGDIGPEAALPVMEGKALLFKQFGGVDAVPICLDVTDVDQLVDTVARLAPAFGGINLEDISAPRCFEVERRLQARLDIPVFHDDQHGTAIVVLAALRNAARLTGRTLADLRVVVSGAGAAGIAVSRMVLGAGIGDLAIADSRGMVHVGRDDLNDEKRLFAEISNRSGHMGSFVEALRGADVLVGLSSGTVPPEAVSSMNPDAIVFAMANPEPEVHPDVARACGAAVVATGRSDFPNQINNVLAFPGVFAGAMSVRARRISEGMKLAAADALAAVVGDDLTADCVIPSPFDARVAPAVAAAVAQAARDEGVARL